jgi:aminoglycoside phosphotransferase (APT) family kinase protein
MNQFNPTDILQHLNIGSFLVVQQETRGADTKIWKVMVDQGFAALRVFPPERAEQFKFELFAMNLASSVDVVVPAIYATGQFKGHPCMVIEWIDGSTMLEACDSPESIRAVGRRFGKLHRQLHENTMRQDDTSLLHLDYHPLNTLVEGGKIAGIIDWTNSAWGDPRQDVARTVSILLCTPLLSREDKKFSRSLRRIARAYLEGYGNVEDLRPFLREAAGNMVRELDYHVSENGFAESKNARRMISRWFSFNR